MSFVKICPMTQNTCGYTEECGIEETDCAEFEQFGMTCDECDGIGSRESIGWTLLTDGRTICDGCITHEHMSMVEEV